MSSNSHDDNDSDKSSNEHDINSPSIFEEDQQDEDKDLSLFYMPKDVEKLEEVKEHVEITGYNVSYNII